MGNAISAPRAQTLALQAAVNRVMRGLLRAPLLCRVVGRWLMTLYVVGRKSGKRYAVPVAYTRHGNDLVVGTSFGWGRNLRTGTPVQLRLRGKRRTADVKVITDEAGVVENHAIMARDNRQFAKIQQDRARPGGNPNPNDLHLAWATGARAFRLTLLTGPRQSEQTSVESETEHRTRSLVPGQGAAVFGDAAISTITQGGEAGPLVSQRFYARRSVASGGVQAGDRRVRATRVEVIRGRST